MSSPQPSSLSSRRLRRTSRANAFLRVSRGVGLGFGRPLIRLAIRQREAHTAIDRAAITRRPGSISASYKSNGRPSPSPPEPGRKEIICGSKTSSLKHATSAASRPLLLRSNLIQLIPKWSFTHFVVRIAGLSEPFPSVRGICRERRNAPPLRLRSRTADRGWSMDEGSSRDPREFRPRKTAFAREILRRRREDKRGLVAKTWVVGNHRRCVEHRVSCHQPSLAPATRRAAAHSFVTLLATSAGAGRS